MDQKNDVELEKQEAVECASKGKRGFFCRLREKRKRKKMQKIEEIQRQEISIEENKKVEKKLEEVTKEVTKSSERKKRIKNIVFFIFNIVLVAGILIWNVYSTEGFTPLSQLTIRFEYLAVILTFLILIITFDVMAVHRMIYRKTMRSRWCLSYKAAATLRYYDAVTPMATGGQAFMVTYLTGRDVPGSTAQNCYFKTFHGLL